MLDAIFIQSFDGEIENSKIQKLLNSLCINLYNRKIKIILFLNFQSIKLSHKIDIPHGLDIDIVYINEHDVSNPTTQIFHFIINFQTQKYRKILLLESDCHLLKNFDESINVQLSELKNKKWLVLGSKYYGLNKWFNESISGELSRREHINGVAVYNRNAALLDPINEIILSKKLTQNSRNYDYCLHENYANYKIQNQMIDTPLIVNISDPLFDSKLTHHQIKPKAVIIHSKNPLYNI